MSEATSVEMDGCCHSMFSFQISRRENAHPVSITSEQKERITTSRTVFIMCFGAIPRRCKFKCMRHGIAARPVFPTAPNREIRAARSLTKFTTTAQPSTISHRLSTHSYFRQRRVGDAAAMLSGSSLKVSPSFRVTTSGAVSSLSTSSRSSEGEQQTGPNHSSNTSTAGVSCSGKVKRTAKITNPLTIWYHGFPNRTTR